jgi:hypothetical protein
MVYQLEIPSLLSLSNIETLYRVFHKSRSIGELCYLAEYREVERVDDSANCMIYISNFGIICLGIAVTMLHCLHRQ